jgi:hypothetical protein
MTAPDDRATITLEGRDFPLAERVAYMPLMQFADAARKGLDSNDFHGQLAIHDLLRAAIADVAWADFSDHASTGRATSDQLLKLATDAIGLIAARPTVRPSDSSAGPQTTEPSSSASSSETVSSTPARVTASPMLNDPRIRMLKPIEDAAMELLTG